MTLRSHPGHRTMTEKGRRKGIIIVGFINAVMISNYLHGELVFADILHVCGGEHAGPPPVRLRHLSSAVGNAPSATCRSLRALAPVRPPLAHRLELWAASREGSSAFPQPRGAPDPACSRRCPAVPERPAVACDPACPSQWPRSRPPGAV